MKETTTKKSNLPDTWMQSVVQNSFVDEDKITVARQASSATATGEIDEYDTDPDSESDTEFKEVSEGPASRSFTTRSVRIVRAYLWLDIQGMPHIYASLMSI